MTNNLKKHLEKNSTLIIIIIIIKVQDTYFIVMEKWIKIEENEIMFSHC